MITVEQIGIGIFAAKDAIVTFGEQEVSFIKEQARIAPLKRAMICAHKTTEDIIHEMLIALSNQTYMPPHKHLNRVESAHVIEGEADLVLFSDTGKIEKVISLDARNNFFVRTTGKFFHLLLVKTPFFVIHETLNGPFIPEEIIIAPFAPDKEDINNGLTYIKKIHGLVKSMKHD